MPPRLPGSPLRILLLEESEVDAGLISAQLEAAGLGCALRRVVTQDAFEEALAEGDFALILADYLLSAFDGLAALRMARAARPDVPFVFVSASSGEERAVETLKLGATDYVLKQRLELLAPAVARALREAEDRRRSQRATFERARLLARERVARAEAEQALRHMEETLALVDALFTAAPVGLAFVDRELRCGRINERLAALSGRPPEEHVGRRLPDMIPHLGPEMERLHRLILETGAAIVDVEVTEDAPGPERRTWLTSCYPVRRSDGTVLGVGTIVVDATERKRKEEVLEELVEQRTRSLQRANQELEAFAYTVSHDLRAPLRAMEGFSQALIEDHADRLDAEGQDYARRIAGAAARLDTLINDILTYSRLSRSELKLEPVLVDDVVREALARISPDTRGGGTLSVETGACAVLGNRTTLVQAVTNLLDNAFKFVVPGKPASVAVCAEDRGGLVRVSVEDDGIGIPAEERERIFRVFERLHGIEAYPGTGIGLAIVRKAAERMGGRVGVEGGTAGGTLFWIELQKAAS